MKVSSVAWLCGGLSYFHETSISFPLNGAFRTYSVKPHRGSVSKTIADLAKIKIVESRALKNFQRPPFASEASKVLDDVFQIMRNHWC